MFATLPINELAVITKRRNLERNEEFFDDNDERLFPHDHQYTIWNMHFSYYVINQRNDPLTSKLFCKFKMKLTSLIVDSFFFVKCGLESEKKVLGKFFLFFKTVFSSKVKVLMKIK